MTPHYRGEGDWRSRLPPMLKDPRVLGGAAAFLIGIALTASIAGRARGEAAPPEPEVIVEITPPLPDAGATTGTVPDTGLLNPALEGSLDAGAIADAGAANEASGADDALQLSCNVDCSVVVDGKARGAAPVSIPVLKRGKHRVRFSADTEFGRAVKEMVVTTVEGELKVVEAQFVTGSLMVFSNTPVEVMVLGKKVGPTPTPALRLIEGQHEVVAVHKKLGSKTKQVTIRPGGTTAVRFEFKKR